MSEMSPGDVQHEIERRLGAFLETQPWWKRYANTVTSVITNATLVAWLVVSSGIEISETVQWAVAALLFVANVLGIKQTPNGLTPSLADKIGKGGRRRL